MQGNNTGISVMVLNVISRMQLFGLLSKGTKGDISDTWHTEANFATW